MSCIVYNFMHSYTLDNGKFDNKNQTQHMHLDLMEKCISAQTACNNYFYTSFVNKINVSARGSLSVTMNEWKNTTQII